MKPLKKYGAKPKGYGPKRPRPKTARPGARAIKAMMKAQKP